MISSLFKAKSRVIWVNEGRFERHFVIWSDAFPPPYLRMIGDCEFEEKCYPPNLMERCLIWENLERWWNRALRWFAVRPGRLGKSEGYEERMDVTKRGRCGVCGWFWEIWEDCIEEWWFQKKDAVVIFLHFGSSSQIYGENESHKEAIRYLLINDEDCV